MLKHFIVFLLLFKFSHQQTFDPNAVFLAINVTYEIGENLRIAATVWLAFESEDLVPNITETPQRNILPVPDPCSSPGLNPCSQDANCNVVNEEKNLFQCKCDSGFEQEASNRTFVGNTDIIPDGTFCPDIDECTMDLLTCGESAAGSCINIPGSYLCSCSDGYGLSSRNICEDVNECDIPTLSQCNSSLNCVNTRGGFFCAADCPPGYTENASNCIDNDECNDSTLICGVYSESCINTPGSYQCNCLDGFALNSENICEDVDECTSYPCDSNANCSNLPGSYMCSCNPGYEGDETTCSDLDECIMDPLICGEDLAGSCLNINGSYECRCSDGFNLSPENICEDVDECATQPCSGNAECENFPGNFMCSCKVGYEGDGFTCTDKNECINDNPCAEEANCTNLEGSYLCLCKEGLVGDGNICVEPETLTSFYYRFVVRLDPTSENEEFTQITEGLINIFESVGLTLGNITVVEVQQLAINEGLAVKMYFDLTNTTKEDVSRTIADFSPTDEILSLSELNECEQNLADCETGFDCVDQPGDYRCVERNDRKRGIAAQILSWFYAPVIGIPSIARYFRNNFDFSNFFPQYATRSDGK